VPDEGPRRPWSRSDRPIPRRLVRPLQEFLSTAAAGGLVLLAATAAALIWANSPASAAYERLWSTDLSVRLGGWSVEGDLRFWVNEGLMALFFLLVGLEIKRELLIGELRDRRAAVLPVLAAIGGMAVPALIYLAINAGGAGVDGWGVAMPTDIAFAVGVLTLVASAPSGLRPFLLTLAIVDDIGTIAVIALFSSEGVRWLPLLVALVVALAVMGLRRIHVRAPAAYVALGVLLWIAMERSGAHPALAGVVMGLLTPAVPFERTPALAREAVSPLARVEHLLLPWVSFVVLPLFALANAGVELSADALARSLHSPVTIGIVAGRVVGKIVGITLACWLAVRTGIAPLPSGARWRHIVGIGATAAIAFTVSLFVAELALPATLQDVAKIGILASALVGGALGFVILRRGPAQSS
jgi:NhaA family Na+:H+ antiporter